jgi:predicted N-acetyltransferase YhbS
MPGMSETVPYETRAYRGAADLRRMQELLRDVRDTVWHVGDLAWAMRERSHFDLSLHIRLLFAGDELIGWTWITGGGFIEMHLTPAHRSVAIYAVMLQQSEARLDRVAGAGDPVAERSVFLPDHDHVLAAALAQRGFSAGTLALQVNRRELDQLPDVPALPAGWSFAAVDTDERINSRVECHRAAFAPSMLTAAAYNRARRTWPYRAELDRVIIDETGAVVAACTSWLDEANHEGLLEPVATRPADQRRGYGRAVCVDALHALRTAGATATRVLCVADSVACATYRAIGFEPCGRLTSFSKDSAAAPG